MSEERVLTAGDDYLALLQWAIPELIEKAAGLKFDQRNRVDLWLVLLYASILELANGACRLVSIGEPTGSRTLVRMAMEAYVDLTNLNADDDYAGFLDVSSLSEWQKTYDLAKEGNVYFKALCDVPGFDEEVTLEAERLAELRKNGYNKLNAKERFERAEMSAEYQGIYHWLCSDTHNSLRGLSLRHIDHVDGEDFKIHVLKDVSFNSELPIMDFLLSYLIVCSKVLHGRFGGDQGAADELERRFLELREKY